MDRGSSSFSQRLRALTSRPDGDEGEPGAAPAQDQPAGPSAAAAAAAAEPATATPPTGDEQATTEWAAPAGGDPPPIAPPPPRDTFPAAEPASPAPAAPAAGDDAATIEWRAIRMPERDGPTLDPPKLQKPSKTPRPAAPGAPAAGPIAPQPPAAAAPSSHPGPQFAKPEAVSDPPSPATEPAPPPTSSWGASPAPAIPEEAEGEPKRGSLWSRLPALSRTREEDADIVSVDSQRTAHPMEPEQPAARRADIDPEQTSSLTAALRRFKPAKPEASEDPGPASSTPTAAVQPTSSPDSAQQTSSAFTPEPVPEKPSFAERAALRRRAKSLRARRDAGLLELGAIVLDQRRFGDASGGSLTRKRTDELADIDNELADIEVALGEDKPMTAVLELGIQRCASCAALVGPHDRFCAQCGTGRDSATAAQPAS